MKLEAEMYVRTKEGNIEKICAIENEHIYTDEDYLSWYPSSNAISKASHNIIDLMEENDLIKIEYYSERYETRVTRLFEVTFKEGRYINLDNAKCQFLLIDNDWTDNDKKLKPIIKSIVTKQQMESMQYEVK